MSDDQPKLVVREQQSPVHGWVIVAQQPGGVERPLPGVFSSKAAAERWIKTHPYVEPDTKPDN